ncbi:MAG: TRAP transporter large permease [Rhodobacteraceae bacterium]|jgi:C4-dicarboxylate transporter DctM subunit|nr:TRAP transporter large permease [Paracoccaceae bacterium]
MGVAFSLFLFLLAFGAPVVFALGAASVFVLTVLMDVPVAIVAQRVYAGLNSFTIMAIPFFVLAGLIMDAGGISRRIVALADAVVGWMTGSLLMVSVVSSTGMAAVSGSGTADTAAISAIMQPEIKRRRYDVDFAAAVIAAGGSLAAVIPPSLFMIVIATISSVSVGALFLAGIVPGLMIGAGLILISWLHARRGGPQYRVTQPFSTVTLLRSFWAALPALGLPAIIVGGIVGGIFTPTEAASIAVLYGLFVGMVVYRELKPRKVIDIVVRAVGLSAAVMMIIASASIFGWLVARANLPQLLGGVITEFSDSPLTFLMIVTVLLLVVGMFMESIAAMLILVPILSPVAQTFGVDPVHFSLVVVLNLTVGMITPPYGITLYVAASVAGRPIMQVARRALQPFLIMLAVLLLVTFVPDIPLFVPRLVMGY